MTKLELAKKEMELKRVILAKEEMHLKILERQEDIERIEKSIVVQEEKIVELKELLAEIRKESEE